MSTTLLHFLSLMAGIAVLVVGGKLLVDSSVSIATRLGVSSMLIGLTIVAWGTSAPELAFNTTAAIKGETGLVFGNVIGANICNLALIVGVCAVIRRVKVGDTIVRREMPIMLGMLALVCMLAAVRRGFEREDGMILLGVFAVHSAYVIRMGIRERRRASHEDLAKQAASATIEPRRRSMRSGVVGLIVGIVLLGLGGRLASEGAGGLAIALGIGKAVVGVTIVSIGTTMPELIASLMSIRKGHTDLAMGNMVGSCIFNTGCILGIASVITPMELVPGAWVSLGTMMLTAVLVAGMGRTFAQHISRWEGVILLIVYALFLTVQVLRATGRW